IGLRTREDGDGCPHRRGKHQNQHPSGECWHQEAKTWGCGMQTRGDACDDECAHGNAAQDDQGRNQPPPPRGRLAEQVHIHRPRRTGDCWWRSLCKRGRRCQARATAPRSAKGKGQAICPARGWMKRRSGPGVPISKSPPAPPDPPDGGCWPALIPLALVDPPFPKLGGVPGVEDVPFLPVFPEGGAPFGNLFALDPPLKLPSKRWMPL